MLGIVKKCKEIQINARKCKEMQGKNTEIYILYTTDFEMIYIVAAM